MWGLFCSPYSETSIENDYVSDIDNFGCDVLSMCENSTKIKDDNISIIKR